MKRFHETKEYSFSTLVSNYKRFLIPNFQRSYKWGNKQVTDFFSSIEQNDEGYFMGNIICVLGTKVDEGRLIIVDGQQRITTITLTLIALRDYAKEIETTNTEEQDSIVGWISEYLKDRDKKERKDFYILKARKKTYNDVLSDLINNATGLKYDKAQMSYIRAYRTLKNLIEEKVKGNFSKLEEFTTKVLELEIVAIVLNSDKEVFNAFDGLNSKGLGLSTSDQVKNFLFSHAEKLKCLDEVEQRWNEMETDFEKTNPELITKFLRHLWIAEEKYISGKDLYDVIREEIQKSKNQKSLIAYTDKILFYSKFYLGVKFKSFAHYLNDIDKAPLSVLMNFRFLDNQQVYEILLALYIRTKKDKSFKPKYFRDILQTLWNFCLRTKYLIISPAAYERDFATYCKLVRESKSSEVINNSKDFFAKLRKLSQNKDQFVEYLIEDLTYVTEPTLVTYILESLISAKEKNIITLTEKSVEHILPQEPKEWGFSKKDVKDYVHSIGNLTLLHPDDNQKAMNKRMELKCEEIYNKSHFLFNREISINFKDLFIDDYKEAIKQRGEEIAEMVYKMTKI